MDTAPEPIRRGHDVELGNVYKSQKGNIYIIVSVRENNVTALVADKDGELVNAINYGLGYFTLRSPVGRVVNLPTILEIDWY